MNSDALSDDYRRYLAALVTFHLSVAQAVGLGASDYQAVNLLDLDGPLSAGELAQRIGLSTGATTRLVDRLVSAGLAERVADPADRRRVAIAAAARGPERLNAILESVRTPIAAAIGKLDEHQLDGLQAYLRESATAYSDASAKIAEA